MNDKQNDYRINLNSVGAPVSVEITCCGRHIGEMRLKEGEERKCSQCQAVHIVSMGYNHFHIRRYQAGQPASLAVDEAAGIPRI